MNNTEPTHVWYACYGSNLCRERFMRYIENCADTTPPVADRPFTLPHPIYFAKSFRHWDNGAAAFLDDSRSGAAYSRIYKITRAQYEDVKRQEGIHYTKKLSFGEVDGLPVYSFTDTQRNEPLRLPSRAYFSVILRGLRECYGGTLPDVEIARYLIGAVLPGDGFAAARAAYEQGRMEIGPCGSELIAAMVEALGAES